MLRLAQRIYNLLDDIKEESEEKTYILEIPSEGDILIGLTFALAIWALNKYDKRY